MSLQENTDRIRTTHIGSLPRPHDVLDLLRAKFTGQPYDQNVLNATIAKAVKESVRRHERLVRFAKLVGRENVMAGADCGFSSQALYKTEVHPTVVWEKFKVMRQGADLATKQLWK